ncbi:MAG: arsenosugar biosynthesis radical SAM protein ArsS [Myxococcales bacterium]|nr:arsenosugar biosynthesis radical SAM protein ArsS [Myxococcales bacterium]
MTTLSPTTTNAPRAPAGPRAVHSLTSRRLPLAPPEAQLDVLGRVQLKDGTHPSFLGTLQEAGWPKLTRSELEIFQINLGKLCNMTCRHCHVDAGPDRTDAMMSKEVIDACLHAIDQTTAHTVDLTGGAPELHPLFRELVEEAKRRGKHVIDRCNLTILLTPKMADLPEWFAKHEVEVVCSLPHYAARNTDAQRGDGTFEKSLEALRRLNAAGYGHGDPKRRLTLMSNPAGAFLAPNQSHVEDEWKHALKRKYDIDFDRLFALNNMPISRFLEWLLEGGQLEAYLTRLSNAFNPQTITGLMCRNTISISWDGWVYDCDFNQMLDITTFGGTSRMHIRDFDPIRFRQEQIKTAVHCFGCTAGAGSSCSGSTA